MHLFYRMSWYIAMVKMTLVHTHIHPRIETPPCVRAGEVYKRVFG